MVSRRRLLFFVLTAASFHILSSPAHAAKKEPLASKQEPFLRSLLGTTGLGSTTSSARGPPHGTPSGFSPQSKYVGLGRNGIAIAVGDFNRDRFADLLMLNAYTYAAVSVFIWDHDKYKFVPRGKPLGIQGTPLSKVVSAHLGDFNNDGALDVLLADGEIGFVGFGDGLGNFNASNPVMIPEIGALTVVDTDADLAPELFVSFANGTRGFWQFKNVKGEPTAVSFRKWDPKGPVCPVTQSASISSVDLDGDCLPEFVIPTACGLEVWNAPTPSRPLWDMQTKRDMRLLGMEVFNAAHGDGAVVFADFDVDGSIDIAVANANRRDLIVHLNVHNTRPADGLCTADPDWRLERKVGIPSGKLPFGSQRVGKLLRGYDVPAAIHIGDYDFDGRPDLILVDADSGRPSLFRNVGHWRHDSPHTPDKQFPHFQRLNRNIERKLWRHTGADAVVAGFLDVDESGRQDLLIVRRANDTRLVWNNLPRESDALFFKGTVLSGLDSHALPRPFASVPGSTFQVSYASRLTGRRVVRTCSQCPQGGHWKLRACNCVLALAHIANYVEEMAVGAGGYRRSWTNLMPNSMAVVWPEMGEKAARWRMMNFTQRRGGQMLRVVAVLVAALAALGAAIVWLQRKERKQDREDDNRERARLFHFGGL